MAISKNINDDITLAYLLKKTKESTLNVLNKAVEKINNTITEITTNMPAWIDVNISYVSGETVEDKVARLLTGTYLPRGKPFVGRVRSGSYFFVAGHLYISSGKLYGAMVFNGIGSDQGGLYGIYDSTIYKQSIRPEDVVKKAGDTMTGDLTLQRSTTISANTPAALRFKTIQIDNGVTSNANICVYDDHDANTYGTNMVIQSYGNVIIGGGESPGTIYTNLYKDNQTENLVLTSDGSVEVYTNCQTYANRVRTVIDASGNFSGKAANVTGTVAIANGGTGQTAVTSISTVSQIATAASGWTISSAHFSQWGKLAQIKINVKPSAAAGTTGDITVATLVSGKRPILETSASCPWPGMTYAFVRPNGAIVMRTTSWAASAERYIIATYLLP